MIRVDRMLNSTNVVDALADLFILRGAPNDNGPDFIAMRLRDWLNQVGIKPRQIYSGSPWENGYTERFNGTLRKKMLSVEWFHSIRQAQIAINV